MNYIKFLLKHLLDLPKTVLINFRIFDFKQAIHMPILISRKVKVVEIHRGAMIVPDSARTFSIKIGIDGAYGVAMNKKDVWFWEKNLKCILMVEHLFQEEY